MAVSVVNWDDLTEGLRMLGYGVHIKKPGLEESKLKGYATGVLITDKGRVLVKVEVGDSYRYEDPSHLYAYSTATTRNGTVPVVHLEGFPPETNATNGEGVSINVGALSV